MNLVEEREKCLFEHYYDLHDLDNKSEFGYMTRKQAIIEADHLHKALVEILEYLEDGGDDLEDIKYIVRDGLYESRI